MKTAYLFPGQGSQYVGMGKDLCEQFPEATEVFDEACEVLGFDLKKMCFEGPEEDLRQTQNTQPAIFVHSIAALRALGWTIEGQNSRLAGHSLGEYSAYVASGAMRFADGLRLVRRRGELMHRAGIDRPGTMGAVLGLDFATIESTLEQIEGVVVPANYNSPTQLVISGEIDAVSAALSALESAGAKKVVPLVVGGAFHSPLMASAAEGLRASLSEVSIHRTRANVIANESAAPVNEPDQIRASLGRQLLSPVRWEQTVREMLDWGAEAFVEIGPGKVLSGLVRAVERRASTKPLGTAEQISAARAESEVGS